MFQAMKSGSISSVRMLVKLFELRIMSEGRKAKIILLDGQRLEILVQPKLYTGELLDLVVSHFSLKEKEYFGLTFKDDSGHHHWLQMDRHVLEHEFPKRTGPLVLFLAVRFYVESISFLKDNSSVELFYLQAKQSIYKGTVECDSGTSFMLAAYVLQADFGDYQDESLSRSNLKKVNVLPTESFKEHPSIPYCEDQVISHYQKLVGLTRGASIVNYMAMVESLPMYGIHYYEVKDKSGIPWWLGISHKGISLYDYNDKKVPRRVFAWKQLENLYFRDRKFSIEVHDPKRISIGRRTFGPPNSINVHSWLASNQQLTKCIWTMAVAQHQFYLDCRQFKVTSVRSMQEIASNLTNSRTSLQTIEIGGQTSSMKSLSSSSNELENGSSASSSVHKDLFGALNEQKEFLEAELCQKIERLRELCLQEAEITGVLPEEMPAVHCEVASTAANQPSATHASTGRNFCNKSIDVVADTLMKLEKNFELQDKITAGFLRLAKDVSVTNKWLHKSQVLSYRKAYKKLKNMEKRLNKYRQLAGKSLVHVSNAAEEVDFSSPSGSPILGHRRRSRTNYSSFSNSHMPTSVGSSPDILHYLKKQSEGDTSMPVSEPCSPMHLGAPAETCVTLSPLYAELRSPVHRNKQMDQTLSVRHSCVDPAVRTDLSPFFRDSCTLQNHRFEDENNLYNLKTNRTLSYDSTQDLKLRSRIDPVCEVGGHSRYQSKHGSLEGAYRKSNGLYHDFRQLDRNLSSGCLEFEDNCSTSSQQFSPDLLQGKNCSRAIPDTPQSVSTGCVSRFFQNFSSTRSKDTSYQRFACIRQQDPPIQFVTPPHVRQDSNISCDSIDLSPCEPNVVQQILVTKGQNYVEISKPFEMSDVYKYSCHLRSQNSFNSPGTSVSGNCQADNNSRDTMGRSNKSRGRDRFVKDPTEGYRRSRSVQNRSENPTSPMSPISPKPFGEVRGTNAAHTPRFLFY